MAWITNRQLMLRGWKGRIMSCNIICMILTCSCQRLTTVNDSASPSNDSSLLSVNCCHGKRPPRGLTLKTQIFPQICPEKVFIRLWKMEVSLSLKRIQCCRSGFSVYMMTMIHQDNSCEMKQILSLCFHQKMSLALGMERPKLEQFPNETD